MRPNRSARIARLALPAVVGLGSLLGVAHQSNGDFLGWKANSYTVTTFDKGQELGLGFYAVIDVYAAYGGPATLLTVSAAAIQLQSPVVLHDDLNTTFGGPGSWSPADHHPLLTNPSLDSFVTIGGTPGASNSTALVGSAWAGATSQTIPLGASWTDSAPQDGQGLSELVAFGDGTFHAVLVARFVTVPIWCCPKVPPCDPPHLLIFSASLESLIDGVTVSSTDAQTFVFEYVCIPSPAGIVAIALGALLGGPRRRRG